MNLKGSLARLQKSGADFYLELAQQFESNQLISETWAAMAHDLEHQAASLEALPPSLWRQLRDEPGSPTQALQAHSLHQVIDLKENKSLHGCLASMLDMEEPLILRIYVPIIRHLRAGLSDQALEFYIMVKAHVARLCRLVQPFAGDPVLLQRVNDLQELFEHEVQTPVAPVAPPKIRPAVRQTAVRQAVQRKTKTRKVISGKKMSKSRRALPLAEHAKHSVKRAKTLVGKLDLPRRRARR